MHSASEGPVQPSQAMLQSVHSMKIGFGKVFDRGGHVSKHRVIFLEKYLYRSGWHFMQDFGPMSKQVKQDLSQIRQLP